jgi:hypothetical protein
MIRLIDVDGSNAAVLTVGNGADVVARGTHDCVQPVQALSVIGVWDLDHAGDWHDAR